MAVKNVKSVLSSKTMWLALAQLITGVVAALEAPTTELKFIGVVMALKSLVDAYLRFTTDTKLVLSK